jgi:hypothetical protein
VFRHSFRSLLRSHTVRYGKWSSTIWSVTVSTSLVYNMLIWIDHPCRQDELSK